MTTLNAVFQGGGVKGIGLVGALARVEEEGVEFAGVAGTSAGSIVAALYAAGYKSSEIKDLLMKTDFTSLLDPGWMSPVQLWKHYGIYRGLAFYAWIYKLLEAKKVVNFEDLNGRKHDLKIIASDVTDRSIVEFNREKNPGLKVAQAVRMSIGIPFFFHAYRYGESLVVDGGLLSNYPLWAFTNSREPTLGFKLVSKSSGAPPIAPNSFPRYLTSLVSTMLEAHDKEDEKTIDWARTIHIPTYDVVATDFGINEDKKQQLYESGYNAACQYIRANPKLAPPTPVHAQAVTPFESLVRLKKLPEGFKDKAFKPGEIRRTILIDRPNAQLEVVENLVNISGQVQHELIRYIATDTRTDIRDLDFKAWVKLKDREQDAATNVEVSSDRKTFRTRIGFRGWVVNAGEGVQIRWRTKAPSAVPLNEDYWVFGIHYFEQRAERFVVEAHFVRVPVDLLFLVETETGMSPLTISGPESVTIEGKTAYKYSTTIESPGEFYLLRWRLE